MTAGMGLLLKPSAPEKVETSTAWVKPRPDTKRVRLFRNVETQGRGFNPAVTAHFLLILPHPRRTDRGNELFGAGGGILAKRPLPAGLKPRPSWNPQAGGISGLSWEGAVSADVYPRATGRQLLNEAMKPAPVILRLPLCSASLSPVEGRSRRRS
jgi:hypothetical protein